MKNSKLMSSLVLGGLLCLTGCGGYDNSVTGPTEAEDPSLSEEAIEASTMGEGATRDPTIPE